MIKILIVGLGGFLGSISRFGVYQALDKHFESTFPNGTLIVNLLGCFLLGIIAGFLQKGNVLSEEWRLFLAIGFCGSFTTFSTFAFDNLLMLKGDQFLTVLLYTAISVVVGIGLTYLGFQLSSK